MAESLALFDGVVNSRLFLRTSIILFLNKIDIFRDKLPRVSNRSDFSLSFSDGLIGLKVPLEQCFQEYTGGPDVNKATEYISLRFMQANRARLDMYRR